MFEMTPSVIDARSCVPFEPQKLEFSSTCQNFIELPRCQLESHTQSVLNGPIKKSHKGLSPVNELATKLVNYDLLKKPLTKCNSTWWIF
jgi:hypothetical protein